MSVLTEFVSQSRSISKGLLPPDTPRTAGPSLFTKKPYNQEEFVEFHLAPKKGRPASKQTQLAQTIAKELGKDATLEVLEDPKVFERFTEVQEIEGKKVTKETKPKVAEKIQREPGVSFSITDEIINVRDVFQLETTGIDDLLKAYKQDLTFNIKTKDGRKNFIESVKKELFPLLPKQFFFNYNKKGEVISSIFTTTNKNYGLSMSNPSEAKIYNEFRDEILELGKLPDSSFGKDIEGC